MMVCIIWDSVVLSHADYSAAYQQQQQTAAYAGYSYGTQGAQPPMSVAPTVSSYQTSYPSVSTAYGTLATAPTAYGQTAATSYSGYTPTSATGYSAITPPAQTGYSATAKPESYPGAASYQDPNAAARSAADGAQATYAAQPPPPPQPSAPQPPVGQVHNKSVFRVFLCI